MSLPTIELVWGSTVAAARRSLRDAVKVPFDLLGTQDGVIKLYYGLQHEDQSKGYLILAWKSLEHHQRVMLDRATHPKLAESVAGIFDTREQPLVRMFHVLPRIEPYKAFEAPVLELSIFTLFNGCIKDDLETLVAEVVERLNARNDGVGTVHASWGPSVERPNIIVLFVGLTSVDVPWWQPKTDESLIGLLDRCRAISKVDVVHVPMVLYETQ